MQDTILWLCVLAEQLPALYRSILRQDPRARVLDPCVTYEPPHRLVIPDSWRFRDSNAALRESEAPPGTRRIWVGDLDLYAVLEWDDELTEYREEFSEFDVESGLRFVVAPWRGRALYRCRPIVLRGTVFGAVLIPALWKHSKWLAFSPSLHEWGYQRLDEAGGGVVVVENDPASTGPGAIRIERGRPFDWRDLPRSVEYEVFHDESVGVRIENGTAYYSPERYDYQIGHFLAPDGTPLPARPE